MNINITDMNKEYNWYEYEGEKRDNWKKNAKRKEKWKENGRFNMGGLFLMRDEMKVGCWLVDKWNKFFC